MRTLGDTLSRRARSSLSVTTPVDTPIFDVEWLYRTYAAKVGRWAARLGGPATEVEDVVQEVFLVAKRRLISFRADGGGKITTWLFRTTERIVMTARRKQRLRRFFGATAADDIAAAGGAGPIPSDEIERRQEIARVYRVLDRLPERQRRVLILFELEGLSTQEIAALVGARIGTVRVWLYRARAAFLEHHDQLTAPDRKSEDDGR
jgi:RNA polymerase sigma factor (sigma-70 family)